MNNPSPIRNYSKSPHRILVKSPIVIRTVQNSLTPTSQIYPQVDLQNRFVRQTSEVVNKSQSPLKPVASNGLSKNGQYFFPKHQDKTIHHTSEVGSITNSLLRQPNPLSTTQDQLKTQNEKLNQEVQFLSKQNSELKLQLEQYMKLNKNESDYQAERLLLEENERLRFLVIETQNTMITHIQNLELEKIAVKQLKSENDFLQKELTESLSEVKSLSEENIKMLDFIQKQKNTATDNKITQTDNFYFSQEDLNQTIQRIRSNLESTNGNDPQQLQNIIFSLLSTIEVISEKLLNKENENYLLHKGLQEKNDMIDQMVMEQSDLDQLMQNQREKFHQQIIFLETEIQLIHKRTAKQQSPQSKSWMFEQQQFQMEIQQLQHIILEQQQELQALRGIIKR